jgi:hypothetical protein
VTTSKANNSDDESGVGPVGRVTDFGGHDPAKSRHLHLHYVAGENRAFGEAPSDEDVPATGRRVRLTKPDDSHLQ